MNVNKTFPQIKNKTKQDVPGQWSKWIRITFQQAQVSASLLTITASQVEQKRAPHVKSSTRLRKCFDSLLFQYSLVRTSPLRELGENVPVVG